MADLQHLRTFAAVVDSGGVTRAALRLHLSQPAISRQIDALEAALGVRLFERVGRRLQLTTAGEDLLRHGRRVLDEAEALRERARALRSGAAGVLKIGATPPMIESILAGFLPGYRARHPGVDVRVVEDGGARLASRLEQGDIQLAHVPADGRFPGWLLYPVHVVAVVRDDCPSARRGQLEIAALAEAELLVLQQGFGSRQWLDEACRDAGVRPRIALESSSHSVVLELARAGYGTGILPSAIAVPGGGLRRLPIVQLGTPIGRWTMLAWNRRRVLAPYVSTFAAEIVAHARRVHPGRDLARRTRPIPRPALPTADGR